MVTKSWLYDAILYIYALSLLFFFSDFATRKQSAKRMGSGLLVMVWVLQSVFYISRILDNDYNTSVSMFDTLFLLSWLMVTVSLIISYLLRVEFLVLLISMIGFSTMIINMLNDRSITPFINESLISSLLLFIHILLGMGSYVAFLIAALFSGMYLFLHRKLKEKQWSDTMKRLPSLEKIERYAYLSVMIGMSFLFVSMIFGSIWMISMDEMKFFFDYKVFNTLLVFIGYGLYLLQRFFLRWPGHKLSVWSLICFAVVVLNYTVSNLISHFHNWIWM